MSERKPRIAFVNDTSLRTPHFGCQLVGQTFREQLARTGLDLMVSLPGDFSRHPDWQLHLDRVDLVIINGEGAIHHGRFQELIDLAARYPCALVNCVYQQNPENPNLRKFRYIGARESLSAAAIRNHGAEVEVVPDVLFASKLLNSFVSFEPAKREFGFTDCAEKVVKQLGPFKFRYRPGFSPKTPVVGDYLNFLASHRRMAIGRFHAAVCCSVMGIPFSTWDSNTWKTEGMMKDMNVGHLHFNSRDEALANAPREFPPQIAEFRGRAKRRIEAMFDRLAQIARETNCQPT